MSDSKRRRRLAIGYAVAGSAIGGAWAAGGDMPAWEHALRLLLIIVVVPPLVRLARRRLGARGHLPLGRLVAAKVLLIGVALLLDMLLATWTGAAHVITGVVLSVLVACGGPVLHRAGLASAPAHEPTDGTRTSVETDGEDPNAHDAADLAVRRWATRPVVVSAAGIAVLGVAVPVTDMALRHSAESRIAGALDCLHPAGGAEVALTGPLAGLRSLDGRLGGVRISARGVRRQGVTADITVAMRDVSGHGFGSGTATATIGYAQLQQRMSQQGTAPAPGPPAAQGPRRISLSGDGRHLLLVPAQLPIGIKADLKVGARSLTITPVSLSAMGRDVPLAALTGRTPHALPAELLKARTMALPNLPSNVQLTSATPGPDALGLSFALSPAARSAACRS
ncbi:LmeA family phospholipid-binding protein [Actinomadura nitritigenes]|uniref:LmeA family phospholipid-binding protein n=1 Tax=Actinomadura nitritigenes TaxID=134602 RepID=UPI003D8F6374